MLKDNPDDAIEEVSSIYNYSKTNIVWSSVTDIIRKVVIDTEEIVIENKY